MLVMYVEYSKELYFMGIEKRGRVLGVDYGDVRTGIAISDDSRFLASGITTLRENGMVKTPCL